MSDYTHDHADDGFHEIHLSGKQLVFLFMATTVVSVVIFLLGVWVGRGVPVQQPLDQVALAATEETAPPPSAPAPVADSGVHAIEPPAPPAETDELSYRRRLEGGGSAESLERTPDPSPSAPAPEPEETPQAAPAAQRASASQPARRATPAPVVGRGAAEAASGGTAQPGTWVVQVHALRDRNVASGIVQRLVTRGYPAFLVSAGPPSGFYRVQVGRFKDRSEAERVMERLAKEEQFKPWITR